MRAKTNTKASLARSDRDVRYCALRDDVQPAEHFVVSEPTASAPKFQDNSTCLES